MRNDREFTDLGASAYSFSIPVVDAVISANSNIRRGTQLVRSPRRKTSYGPSPASASSAASTPS